MNAFLSAPVLCELGAELKEGASLLCLAASFVIALGIGFILSAVGSDKSSYAYDLPLAYLLGGGFSYLALGGIFTSLVSSFYPLYVLAGKGKIFGKIALVALGETCALIPFKSIVSTVYPAIGIFGLFAVTAAAISYAAGGRGGRRKFFKSPEKRAKKAKEFD